MHTDVYVSVCGCEVSLDSLEWQPVIHLVWDLTSPCYFAAVNCPIPHFTPLKQSWSAWTSSSHKSQVITLSASQIKGWIPHAGNFKAIYSSWGSKWFKITTHRKFVSFENKEKWPLWSTFAFHKGLLGVFNLAVWHLYLGNTVSSWHTGLLNHTVHVASHQTEACDSFWILCNVLTSSLEAGCCLLLLFLIHNFPVDLI